MSREEEEKGEGIGVLVLDREKTKQDFLVLRLRKNAVKAKHVCQKKCQMLPKKKIVDYNFTFKVKNSFLFVSIQLIAVVLICLS